MNKPKCLIHGQYNARAMCGDVIVGGVYCGRDGDCIHKQSPANSTQEHRDQNPEPVHGVGHMQGRGAA